MERDKGREYGILYTVREPEFYNKKHYETEDPTCCQGPNKDRESQALANPKQPNKRTEKSCPSWSSGSPPQSSEKGKPQPDWAPHW